MTEKDNIRRLKSIHQKLVEEFLEGAGHEIPKVPMLPSEENILTWARLIMEESFELCEASNVDMRVTVDGKEVTLGFTDIRFVKRYGADLENMADAFGDINVVATGGLSICGIADIPLLEEIDFNNIDKLEKGYRDDRTGKFIKPPDHQPPDITTILLDQGWNCDIDVEDL